MRGGEVEARLHGRTQWKGCRLSPVNRSARKQCFIGFYGLNRSLRWTAPSIRKNILEPLRREGFDCFLAGHFNQPRVIHHPGSRERNVKVRYKPGKHLNLDLSWVEPQSDAVMADLIEVALSVPFPSLDDPTGGTRRNIAYQLHSLRRLGQLLELVDPERFDVFLLLRPDIEYIDMIDMDAVLEIASGGIDIVTPSWQLWDGMNDRFCFASRSGALSYLNRWRHLRQFCTDRGFIHPESFLKHVVDQDNLRIRLTEQRALRVRATGETWTEGFHLPRRMRLFQLARPLLNALP